LLTVRPLGAIRVLRRYVTTAVVVVLGYLFIQLVRRPLPPLTPAHSQTVMRRTMPSRPLAWSRTRNQPPLTKTAR